MVLQECSCGSEASVHSSSNSSSSSGSTTRSNKRKSADIDGDACFICLDSSGTLVSPCACPRLVHSHCLARWQLQQAGRREERWCRFCSHELPDWKRTLTPSAQQPRAPVQPVMVVALGERVHRIAVRPGPDGMREFQARIRTLFNIPAEVEFEVSFRCKAPVEHSGGVTTADTIHLEGMSSYEAATHCASLMAAQRAAAARNAVATR